MTVRVPAKVNLQLSVGPLRPDGYHDLVTVFHAVSLFDEVTVTPASQTSVSVTGVDAALVPTGRTNLAVRAVQAVAAVCQPRPEPGGVRIRIRKRIPVAAGLAGGSSNAAAALVACNELWQAGLSHAALSELAASIGSDVPFGLTGGTAVGQGRGELLSPALTAGTYHWVLAFATGGLSTPEVYAACDRLRAARPASRPGPASRAPAARAARPASSPAGPPVLSAELMSALRSGSPEAVGPLLGNDLQAAALSLRPDLRRTLAAGSEHGALGAVVSGSGPTCVFLAADAHRAADLAVSLTGAGVCRSVAGVQGPVPGAAAVTAERG